MTRVARKIARAMLTRLAVWSYSLCVRCQIYEWRIAKREAPPAKNEAPSPTVNRVPLPRVSVVVRRQPGEELGP